MQRLTLFAAGDYPDPGLSPQSYVNTQLDYTANVGPYGNPAVVPNDVIASLQTESGAALASQAANAGANRAVIAQFPVTTDSTGTHALAFVAGTGTPAINAIEVVDPALGQVVLVNCGGPRLAPWSADEYYTGGTAGATASAIDTASVASPAPQAVYQTQRAGMSAYTIPGLGFLSPYTLRLHVAETLGAAVGARVFSVAVNGQPFLSAFDIAATATFPAATTNAGNAWAAHGPFMVTPQQGDTLTLATSAYQVTIQFIGQLTAGSGAYAGQGLRANEIRNGGIATISVDGHAMATRDTWLYGADDPSCQYTFYNNNGAAHTIQIAFTSQNGALAPAAPDTTMLGVAWIGYGTGSGGTGASQFLTPVYALGDPQTQPLLATWTESAQPNGAPTLYSVQARAGNTATPDGSWATQTLYAPSLATATTGDGLQHAVAALAGLGRAAYLQLIFTLVGASSAPAWIRDIAIYTWVPETDPLLARVALGQDQAVGPVILALMGCLASNALDVQQEARALGAAATISGATGPYLAAWLADLGLQQVTGEKAAAARARGRAVLGAGGLTRATIAAELAALITGQPAPVPTIAGSPGGLTVACAGVQVTQGAGTYAMAIPPGQYAGLSNLPVGDINTPVSARGIIAAHVFATLRPVGSTTPTLTFF